MMELLISLYGELLATLALVLTAFTLLKKSAKTFESPAVECFQMVTTSNSHSKGAQ